MSIQKIFVLSLLTLALSSALLTPLKLQRSGLFFSNSLLFPSQLMTFPSAVTRSSVSLLSSPTISSHKHLAGSCNCAQCGGPLRKNFMNLQSTAVPLSDPAAAAPKAAGVGKTIKKILPLGLMLFCILFNYTILRDTKDVLVVTAPNSGAEIIPFLKTYVNLPSAIGFTLLYSSLCNRFPADKVFVSISNEFYDLHLSLFSMES